MLPVSAPFHCALMQPAQDRLGKDLKDLTFHHLQLPLVKNVDGELTQDSEVARQALVSQVTGAVQWVKSMQTLIAQGVELFIEVGPGKVLCGLLRQIDRSKPFANVEDEGSLARALAAISS